MVADDVELASTSRRPTYNLQRGLSLLLSVLMMIVAGSQYAFGSYSHELLETLHLDNTQLTMVASALNIGTYVTSPLSGMLYDRVGPRPVSLAGAFFLFLGYMLVWFSVDGIVHVEGNGSAIAFFFFIIGVGNTCMVSGGANTSVKNFSRKWRSSIIGVVTGSMALGGGLWGLLNTAFINRLGYFILTVGLMCVCVALAGAWLCKLVPDIEYEIVSTSIYHERADDAEPLLKDPVIQQEELTDSNQQSCCLFEEQRGIEANGPQLFVQPSFWVLFVAFFISTGAGLQLLDNIGEMAKSMGIRISIQWLVFLMSIASTLGRLLTGTISDALARKTGLAHSVFTVPAVLLLATAQLLIVFCPVPLEIAATIGLFGYGASFAAFPSLTVLQFGARGYGQNMGWLGFGPGMGALAFNGITAALYPGSSECVGCHCYRQSSIVIASLLGLALLVSLIFLVRPWGIFKPRLRRLPPLCHRLGQLCVVPDTEEEVEQQQQQQHQQEEDDLFDRKLPST